MKIDSFPSASQIEQFLMCSHKFLMGRQGAHYNPGVDMRVGTAVHFAIAEDMRQRLDKKGMMTIAHLQRIAVDRLKIELEGFTPPVYDQKQYPNSFQAFLKGTERVRGMIEAYCSIREQVHPVMVEKVIEAVIDLGHGKTVKLSGTADVIEEGYVLDWKTVKRFSNVKPTAQFAAYSMIASAVLKKHHDFRVCQLKDNGEARITDLHFDNRTMRVLMNEIRAIALALEHGVFLPASSYSWACSRCEFAPTCEMCLPKPADDK